MILVIAGATFREALRSRTFAGLLVIYAVAVALSRAVGWISATDGDIVTTDVVFSLQSVIGVLVAVATGTALVQSEIQQKTLYTILSRPVARWQFVVGKFLGLAAGLAVGQVVMLVIALSYLWITGASVHGWLVLADHVAQRRVNLRQATRALPAFRTLDGPVRQRDRLWLRDADHAVASSSQRWVHAEDDLVNERGNGSRCCRQ